MLKTRAVLPQIPILEESNVSKEELVQHIVSGTITDQIGQPLPGASVVEKGTTNGTQSDFDGNFSIELQNENAVLVVSYVGFGTKEVPTNGQITFNITLEESAAGLDEVVVVGYGTQSTRAITGSVENIKIENLRDAPVAQVGEMLQGKVSGLRINQTTGRPGEGMKIRIRGSASITAGSDPLYVIDGMPISGDISDINPNEIENISVLKDAAATSLYGSRGANGVILIQTKSGIPGKTRIEFSTYTGIQKIPEKRRLKMMDANQYAEFQKEVAELNGRPVDPAFQNPGKYGKGTDWYDEITRMGLINSYNLSVNTGKDKFYTSVTAGYFNQEGVVKGTGYERYSLRMNNKFQPNDRLSIGFNLAPTYVTNTNFSSDGNPYGTGNIVSSALVTTPLANPYNPDGSLTLTASDPATFGNPNWLRVAREIVYEDKSLELLSSSFIEYEIFKGLKVKTTANIQMGYSKLFQFNPSTIGSLFNPPPRLPSGSENRRQFYNWLNENTLNYQTKFNNHTIELLSGFTAQKYRLEGTFINATNYADDKVQAVSAAGQTSIQNDIQEWTLLSYLARINYGYQGKYLITASFRSDGSSRFGPRNRWGNFPSASLGWIVSEENFWNIESISFLKLRASYGITGNFNIGNYAFRSTVNPAYSVFGNSEYQGRAINNLGDQGLGWEKNKQLNIGSDVNLLDNKVQITYNYYTRNTSDLLFNVSVPRSSGFSNIQTNIGELKFWGHEIGVETYNIRNVNFSWNTNFNISFDRNKIVSLDTDEGVLYHGATSYDFYSHISEVGYPMAQFYGAIQDGVYVNQDDFNNSPKHASSQVGTIKFRDLNGDGVITFPEDYTKIGNPWPKYTFGITNTLHYNNFDFSVSIVGSYGNKILAHHENWTTNLDGVFNVLEEVKDRWKSPEDPGAGLYGSTQQGTTFLERDRWHSRFIKDGSYLSFRNITLGYQFPL
ncbi:MAG TPA: TonB-dependent receptor, partial [Arenibacter sp.]|nr:TonB-dependent receptor [Arenibacter sp.]